MLDQVTPDVVNSNGKVWLYCIVSKHVNSFDDRAKNGFHGSLNIVILNLFSPVRMTL